ncbi:MAG: CDP-alcohol phosphatidyltransferase family protein [Flavobacteriia bacterium]|jgi:phosphatidylglycerophosphate synthase
MSKLSKEDKFFDLSDYGRSAGSLLAKSLQNTRFTPIHLTLLFGLSGLISVYFIFSHQYILAAVFLILKSIIDASDGELARLKNRPSYTGRYLDSVFDIILNAILVFAICFVSKTPYYIGFIAFFLLQLQGTLYNYYYVILRTISVGGDGTSKIFEYKTPKALVGEKQRHVNFLFQVYLILYGLFDKIIHLMDSKAYQSKNFPNWFMTFVSLFGLGFQLLVMALLLTLNHIELILPYFLVTSVFIVVIIGIRRTSLN